MIDWATFMVPISHDPMKFSGNITMEANPDGELLWQKHRGVSQSIGSYDQKIKINSYPESKLRIDGNPAKVMNGHNIQGSNNPLILRQYLIEVLSSLGFDRLSIQQAINSAYLTRLDITESFDCGSEDKALAWIESAKQYATVARRGNCERKRDTLYFGKRSKYWTLKIYPKAKEVRKHGITYNVDKQRLLDDIAGYVRIEVTLRARELEKLGMKTLSNCLSTVLKPVYENYLAKLKLPKLNDADNKLSNTHARTYDQWKHGGNPRAHMSDSTWYEHRRAILKATGWNIASMPPAMPDQDAPIVHVLDKTAKPLDYLPVHEHKAHQTQALSCR